MKIFLDCADLSTMVALAPEVQGFTTNPTLMRQAGVADYKAFARAALKEIPHLPISFEVIADTIPEMERQAHTIASWGTNAVVKIPIVNTKNVSSLSLVNPLLKADVAINITAIMTRSQIADAILIVEGRPAILSIFAGRIADTGMDPIPIVEYAAGSAHYPTEILWASTREVLNLRQAEGAGCSIITLSPALLGKLGHLGKKPDSLETVQQFYADAQKAGYTL